MKKNDYTLVAEELTKRYINYISGNDDEALFGHKPSDVVMIGMVKAEQFTQSLISENIFNSENFESVPSVGLTFHVSRMVKKIYIQVKGQLYYRVMPTYSEQTKFLLEKYSNKFKKSFDNVQELLDYMEKRRVDTGENYPNEELMYLYKCVNLKDILSPFELNLEDINSSMSNINNEISEKLSEICERLESISIYTKQTNRSIDKILNKDAFELMVKSNCKKIKPTWDIKVHYKINEFSDFFEITLQFLNKTKKLEDIKDTFETTVFDAGIDVISQREFVPIRLNSIKHDYLNPTEIYAIGVNCAVDYSEPNHLKTTNIPIYRQKRVKTVEKYNKYLTFDNLIKNPVENLKFILREMENELVILKNEYINEIKNKDEKYLNKFKEEIENFSHEINRFNDGISLIERKNEVYNAFVLMNKSFAYKTSYLGWRLFQIVFIVSEINDIVYSEYKESPIYRNSTIDLVDMLYFPTGGGKTEAFLGCALFSVNSFFIWSHSCSVQFSSSVMSNS